MTTPIPGALPELLAPAGCWDSLKAAAANGADAVYFGVEAFNARLRAENFRRQNLPELMEWLHRRGLKGFLTVNVLVFQDELEAAADLLLAAAAAGVDAVIVQDVGLCRLARALVPDLALHASTQMSITSAAGIAQAATLGCERVVLARELALKDLRRLRGQLRERDLAMPLEVFVHGALCVAYSGQCLTSEALGQRSANRGECAQACRLPYQLIVDGEERELGDRRYLLSPGDLSAWELLPDLVEAGVASLKIEGRLKDPTYVAAVTEAYRRGLDRLGPGTAARPKGPAGPELEAAGLRRRLELTFSRGLDTGWLEGVDHRRLVDGRWSKKRGPLIARLAGRERGGWLLLRAEGPSGAAAADPPLLKPGDGVVLELPSSDPLRPPAELGGRVMAVQTRGSGLLAIRLGPERVDTTALPPDAPCWLSSDPALERQLRKQAQRPLPERPAELRLLVRGRLGEPLQLGVIQANGALAPGTTPGPMVESAEPLVAARGPGLDRERLEAQLGRLGGSGWHLAELRLDLPDGLFLPLAQLNALRRALVERLEHGEERRRAGGGAVRPPADPGAVLRALQPAEPAASRSPEPAAPALSVLVRSLEQLEALLEEPLHSVIADLEQPAELRRAVALGRGRWPGGLLLAGPRICRPDERWSLEPLLRAEPEGYLVRNADQLELLVERAPCIGDFSLNVANALSAGWFLGHWGLRRITASYDLALDQLLALVAACPPGSVEVTLHQHMPLFHMEHCLFCALLSDGHDHTDCGRPCESHRVVLRDRSGAEHPLRADLGCRNTLFNGTAQTAAEALPALRRAGVRHLRVELLNEGAAEARRRVDLYQRCLSGAVSGRQVWQQERLDSRLGVTRGSLRRGTAIG